MSPFTYRLQPLLEQKDEARKEAERELTRREKELESQLEVLRSLRGRLKELVEKREQWRRDMLSKPSEGETLSAREVQDRANCVKGLGVQIEDAKHDVVVQASVVEKCELRVKECKQRVEEARREVEVLTKHRSKQEERFLREAQAKEELALDEVGNVLYSTRRHSI